MAKCQGSINMCGLFFDDDGDVGISIGDNLGVNSKGDAIVKTGDDFGVNTRTGKIVL